MLVVVAGRSTSNSVEEIYPGSSAGTQRLVLSSPRLGNVRVVADERKRLGAEGAPAQVSRGLRRLVRGPLFSLAMQGVNRPNHRAVPKLTAQRYEPPTMEFLAVRPVQDAEMAFA